MRWGFIVLFISVAAQAGTRLEAGDLEMARAGAMRILGAAAKNDPKRMDLFSALAMKLARVNLNPPNLGYDYTSCKTESLAYVDMYHDADNIFICARSVEDAREGMSQQLIAKLSQTLIHETAHLIGNESECDASRVELQVMKSGGVPLQYLNNYLQVCKLSPE